MSFNRQSSNQKSRQGLDEPRAVMFSEMAPERFNQMERYSQEARNDPGGLQYRNTVDQLLPTGRYGMSQGADQGIMQLGRDMFSSASSNRAQRGFKSPHNLEAVLGDSMRMASSQLVPSANAWAMQKAQMAPALRQASFGYSSAPLNAIQNLLSGSGSGSGKSSGFGVDLSSLVGPAAAMMSDRRLKSDIVRIGNHPLGIGWYEYTIFGERTKGVMADEVLDVMPEAISHNADGYMMVDYALVGRME